MKPCKEAYTRLRRVFAIATAIGVVSSGSFALAQQTATEVDQAAPASRFELPVGANEVVIRMTEHIPQWVSPTYPSVTIYADGRVVRHRPLGMLEAGDLEGRISRDEVRQLVDVFADRGIMEFDSGRVLQRKRQDDAARNDLFYVSDRTTLEIEVKLARYRSAAGVAPVENFEHRVRWDGLQHDARRYTDLAEIQNLSAVHRQLEALGDRIAAEAQSGGAR